MSGCLNLLRGVKTHALVYFGGKDPQILKDSPTLRTTMRETCDNSLRTSTDQIPAFLPLLFPAGIGVWNPAFDVTPHDLITGGIITELGVFAPEELQAALSTTIS